MCIRVLNSKIYIEFSRSDLIERINKRVDQMFKNGVIHEVKGFLKIKVKKDKSSNKIIGIKEIEKFLMILKTKKNKRKMIN